MDNLEQMTKEFIQQEIDDVINEEKLDKKYLQIILLRYGIHEHEVHNLRQIAKQMNIQLKNVKAEVEEAERRLFNILKKKI